MRSIGTDADAIAVLLIEDSPGDVRPTREAFKDAKMHINLHAACYIAKPADLEGFLKVIKSIDSFWLLVVKLPHGSRG